MDGRLKRIALRITKYKRCMRAAAQNEAAAELSKKKGEQDGVERI